MNVPSDAIKPSAQAHYYDKAVYWNDFDPVIGHLNCIVSGYKHRNWIDHIASTHGCFDSAFSLNCGNGWVEREFFTKGVIKRCIGTDISVPLLSEAERNAAAISMPADYRVADCNQLSIPEEVDCVINHAALHHVAYIDRTTRELCRACRKSGYLVSYDYVGPERNQYPWEMWAAIIELWNQLPTEFRTEMQYPHLPTMLQVDPTEAIHSNMILPTLARYFDIIEERPLGGALAYSLLHQNIGLYRAVQEGRDDGWLQRIIDADQEFTRGEVERSFFVYTVAKPKKDVLAQHAELQQWSDEENFREMAARKTGGRYGPIGALEIIYEQMDGLRRAAKQ
jgi:SAM-dependent methyltransferase